MSVTQLLNVILPLVVAPLGILVAGPGIRAIGEVFHAAKNGADERTRLTVSVTVRAFRRALSLCALLCFIIHFTNMLRNLEERDAIWPHLAWAFVPMVGAFLVWAVLGLPLSHAAGLSNHSFGTSAPLDEKPWTFKRWFFGMVLALAGIVGFEVAAFAPWLFSSWLFVDLPSFFVFIFVPAGIVIAGARPRELREAFSALRSVAPSRESLVRALASFRFLGSALRVAACIGGSTGFVLLVRDWLDKTRSGPSMAFLLISVFWCVLAYSVVVLPLEAATERRLLLANGGAKDGNS